MFFINSPGSLTLAPPSYLHYMQFLFFHFIALIPNKEEPVTQDKNDHTKSRPLKRCLCASQERLYCREQTQLYMFHKKIEKLKFGAY